MTLRPSLAAALLAITLAVPALTQTAGSAPPAAPAAAAQPAIVFMTDFGTANDAAAICRAVMAGIAPQARIMDITHQVTPFSIEEAARNLESVSIYYPAGTVFIVVVDPGVGTARKAVIVRTKRGQYFVLPDNGLVTPVMNRDGFEGARQITNPDWMIGEKISSTFHGRDVFSPTAAHLAAGWDWTQAGPLVTELVKLEPKVARLGPAGIEGEVIALDDPYDNLITDIREADFRQLGWELGSQVPLRMDGKAYRFPFVKTFGDVAVGKPLLYIDSRGRVAFSLNERFMSRTYGILPGASVSIPRRGAAGARR